MKNNNGKVSPSTNDTVSTNDTIFENSSSEKNDNNDLVKKFSNFIFLGKNSEVKEICSKSFNLNINKDYGDLLSEATQYIVNNKIVTDKKVFASLLGEVETELVDLNKSTEIIDQFSSLDLV